MLYTIRTASPSTFIVDRGQDSPGNFDPPVTGNSEIGMASQTGILLDVVIDHTALLAAAILAEGQGYQLCGCAPRACLIIF